MKVAYTIGALSRGGAENLLLDICRSTHGESFETLVIYRHDGPMTQEFDACGVERIKLTPRKFHLLQYLREFRKVIFAEKVDVIHAQHWLDSIYGRLAAGRKMPIVLTFHGYVGCECTGLAAMLYRLAICCATKICFVSQTQRRKYIARYGALVDKKSVVVYNGIDFGKFENGESTATGQKPQSYCVKLCMVGNFNSVRNQMVVCQALEKLKGLPIQFFFIGGRIESEGDRYDNCVEFCNNEKLNVVFMGQRNNVPELLHEMDGFVYASANDTFGIAVIEALAAGLPVVVNDLEVMMEITNQGEWARLYTSDNVEDCARAIRSLVEDYQQSATALNEQCQTIAQGVRDRYSIGKHIQTIYSIYQELV